MFFFNEKFEYLVHGIINPSEKDFIQFDYDSKEHKQLEWYREYYSMMLNELGAIGWELVIRIDDPHPGENKAKQSIDKLIFKRSSRSKYYKTGFGVDSGLISKLARERSEYEHIDS